MTEEIKDMSGHAGENMLPGEATEQQQINNEANNNPKKSGEKSSKPWLIYLNILLLAGLALLYVLHFTTGKDTESQTMSQTLAKAGSGRISVAFVNNDSILENYELVKTLKKDLQAKGDRYSADIANKQATFEKDATYFQEQVQKKSISEQSAQEIYTSLMENQQKIYDLRDKYASELQQSEADMNIALLDSVMNFLQRYNTRYKFDYILGFNKGGNILYANDTLDITKDVIRALNDEYHSKHPGK